MQTVRRKRSASQDLVQVKFSIDRVGLLQANDDALFQFIIDSSLDQIAISAGLKERIFHGISECLRFSLLRSVFERGMLLVVIILLISIS